MNRLLSTVLGTTALLCTVSTSWAGPVKSVECSPLQVARIQIENTRLQYTGANVTGIYFNVKSIVRNTNPTRTYIGNNRSQAVISGDRSYPLQQVVKFPRNIRGGGTETVVSKTYLAKRDVGNLAQFPVQLNARLVNIDCPPRKQTTSSVFKFDLSPVLRGGKPKFLRGRLSGYSEYVAPSRSPSGRTGAPRPRT